MKISPISTYSPSINNKKINFCNNEEPKYEKEDAQANNMRAKLIMAPAFIFNKQIRDAILDAHREKNITLDEVYDIKAKSRKIEKVANEISASAQEIIDKAQNEIENFNSALIYGFSSGYESTQAQDGIKTKYQYNPEGNPKLKIVQLKDSKLITLGSLDEEGNIRIKRRNTDGTYDAITRIGAKTKFEKGVYIKDGQKNIEESYDFIGEELEKYSSGTTLGLKAQTEIDFIGGKVHTYETDLTFSQGAKSVGEHFEFDNLGFIRSYQSDMSCSANNVLNMNTVIKFKDLGVMEKYIKNLHINSTGETSMSKAMLFSGAKLDYYVKFKDFNRNLIDRELTFDNEKSVQVTIGGQTFPPVS